MPITINVREEISQAPIGAFHWRFGALMALIMFFDGYDLFNAAYVIPLVRKSWAPSATMIGIMLSSGIVGLSIGSVLQGILADRFGRRRIMLIALWLLTGCSAILATVVSSPIEFAACRLLLGTALGMVTPLMLTYLNEYAPKKHANVFATWIFQLGLSAGGIAAGIVGITLTAHYGWQVLYSVGVLSFIVVVMATAWLPESIQFLALHNQNDKVRTMLAVLRPDRAHVYRDSDIVSDKPASRRSLTSLLAPIYRRNTIVHWIVGFLSLFCIHGLTGWLPAIVVQRGGSVSSAFAYGTLIMIASVFGGIGMGWLADRLGNRIKAMKIGYMLAALATVGLAVAEDQSFMIAMVAAAGFFIFGAQAVLNNYQAMSYHTEIRGTGMGVAVGLNRVGGILGPTLIGIVSTVGGSPVWVFALLAVSLTCAAVIISMGGPEVSAALSSVSGPEGIEGHPSNTVVTNPASANGTP